MPFLDYMKTSEFYTYLPEFEPKIPLVDVLTSSDPPGYKRQRTATMKFQHSYTYGLLKVSDGICQRDRRCQC